MTPFFLARPIVKLFVFATLLILILGFDFRPIHAQQTLTLLPAMLPDGMVGVNYHELLFVDGINVDHTIFVAEGTLPPDLLLMGDWLSAAIYGTPREGQAGSYRFALVVEPNDRDSIEEFILHTPYNVIIRHAGNQVLQLSTESFPVATQNSLYIQAISVSGGTAPYRFEIVEGALPDGLVLSPTGVVSGSPSTSGYSLVKIRITDANGNTITWIYTVQVMPPSAPGMVARGTHYTGYYGNIQQETFSMRIEGGMRPYEVSIIDGNLPVATISQPDPWNQSYLNVDANIARIYNFRLRISDARGQVSIQAFAFSVVPDPVVNSSALQLAPSLLPSGAVGTAYDAAITTIGGTPPFRYRLSQSALSPRPYPLPRGLILDGASGRITGIPVQARKRAECISIIVTDGTGLSGTGCLQLEISSVPLQISPLVLPDATVGVSYDFQMLATGGMPPYYFGISSSTPPDGLTISDGGRLFGIPTTAGTYEFNVFSIDPNDYEGEAIVRLTINPIPLTFAPVQLTRGIVGTSYSQILSISGGNAPYQLAVTGGVLPSGLSLNAANGLVNGIPQQNGNFTFTVTAIDADGLSASYTYTIRIESPMTLPTDNGPEYLLNSPVRIDFQPVNGLYPYQYTTIRANLPYSGALREGWFDGICYPVGNYSFTVEVTDAVGVTDMETYTFSCVDLAAAATATPIPILTFPSLQLPIANVGVPYQALLAVQGGAPPYNFVFLNGTLPPTFGIDGATGLVSGTALDIGNYTFSVQAIDSAGNSGTGTFTLTVAPPDALGGH